MIWKKMFSKSILFEMMAPPQAACIITVTPAYVPIWIYKYLSHSPFITLIGTLQNRCSSVAWIFLGFSQKKHAFLVKGQCKIYRNISITINAYHYINFTSRSFSWGWSSVSDMCAVSGRSTVWLTPNVT